MILNVYVVPVSGSKLTTGFIERFQVNGCSHDDFFFF